MTLFERTKNTAKSRGYSLQDTAKKAGLSQNAIYNWKNSKPSDVSLNSVSNVLGVSVEYLLGKTDDPHISSEPTDDLKKYFEEHHIVRYDGKPIPDSDLEVIKRILESN